MPSAKPPPVDYEAGTQAAIVARRRRAAIKEAVRSDLRDPRDVLAVAVADRTTAEATLRVRDFLLSLPAVGVGKCETVLGELAIAPQKRLGFLGKRQVAALRSWLTTRAELRGVTRTLQPVVLAGPSGVGKGTVAAGVRGLRHDVFVSISVTTRPPRPGEIDGEHYYFVSEAEFQRLVVDEELLEWAEVHGQYRYGTPRRPVDEAVASNTPVLLEIDVQGAMQVKAHMPDVRLIFLVPPSWDALVARLASRGTESPQEQERRLATAQDEMALAPQFDVRVVNDDVNIAARMVLELMGISQE